MGTLTKKERDGLDDVFLSIHTHQARYQKLKELSALLISWQRNLKMKKLLKVAKYGFKEENFSNFILNLSKKKKNLSK